jgi:general stress protein 26
MRAATFAEIQAELMRRVSQAVYCSMATVDRHNRPRARIIHPIWEEETVWVITRQDSPKTKDLERNPHVSLAYIHESQKPVYVDCKASWVRAAGEKQRVWELIKTTPPPLGYEPGLFFSSIADPNFGILRLTPWRIELYNLGDGSVVWRNE